MVFAFPVHSIFLLILIYLDIFLSDIFLLELFPNSKMALSESEPGIMLKGPESLSTSFR